MKRWTTITGGLTGAILLVALLLGATLAGTRVPSEGVAELAPDIRYTLRTARLDGRLVFVGVGGKIDGVVNPTLQAQTGQIVQVTLRDGDGARHSLAFPDFAAKSQPVTSKGSSSVVVLRADRAGSFAYFCAGAGHRAGGMVGRLDIG